MDILEDMIELIMKVYLILMRDLRKCLIELDLILLKSNISGVYSHKHTKIKICDDLLLGKALNVVMLIKHLLYKNHNHYYYHMFLGKCIYKYYVNDIF